jgi:hypothetical protein
LQPSHDAQQSAEAQHDFFAALAAPAKPSAITVNSKIALMRCIDSLL